jgi:hypothetical protein
MNFERDITMIDYEEEKVIKYVISRKQLAAQ